MPIDVWEPTRNALIQLGQVRAYKQQQGRQNALDQFAREQATTQNALSERRMKLAEGQDVRQNALFDLQQRQGQQSLASGDRQAMLERIKIMGPIAKQVLSSPNPEQAYMASIPQVQQLFPDLANKPIPDFATAANNLQAVSQAYDSLYAEKPEYAIQNGQYVPTKPGQGGAQPIPGFEKKPDIEIGTLRNYGKGKETITEEWDGKKWVEKSKSDKFAKMPSKKVYKDGQLVYEEGEDVGPKKLTETQAKSAMFGERASIANDIINNIGEEGAIQPGLLKRSAESIPLVGAGLGTALNWTQSPKQQQVEQAQLDFRNALLRQESGAAISDTEHSAAIKQYFPQPGDSPEVIAQKKQNRETAIRGLSMASGGGSDSLKKTRPESIIGAGSTEEKQPQQMTKETFMKKWFNR